MIKLTPAQLEALRAAADAGNSLDDFQVTTRGKLRDYGLITWVRPDPRTWGKYFLTDAGREYLANYTDLTPRQLKQLENWYYNLSRDLKSSGVHGGSKTNADLLAKGYLEEVPADETGATSKLELSQKGIMYFEKPEAANNV